MNGRPRLLYMWIGVLLSVVGVMGLFWAKPAEDNIVMGDACRTPVHVIEPPGDEPARAPVAVVFHGLAASAAIMEPLGQALASSGWRVYLPDLAGHGRSRESFSYAGVDECAAATVEFLNRSGDLVPNRTIFVGHSLGGATVVRLVDSLPVAATVAISPAPLVPPRRMPSNLLILAGQLDLGPVKTAARQLFRTAGGTRDAPDDFAQRRAVAFHIMSGDIHGTMVLDPRVWTLATGWAARAIGPGTLMPTRAGTIDRPLIALLSNIVLLLGIGFLIAPGLTGLARLFRLGSAGTTSGRNGVGWFGMLHRWALASFFAVSVLGLARADQFVRPVRLADGDWAALAALLTGSLLLILFRKSVVKQFRLYAPGMILAFVAGVLVVVIFAFAVRPELIETPFNGARLWRWAVLVAFTLPYFLAEETALGPPSDGKRWLAFGAMRGLVWLAQVFALVIFWRSGLLLVLLAIGLGIVSAGQRLAADTLRRGGAAVPAVALFDAILAAGTLALILPLL